MDVGITTLGRDGWIRQPWPTTTDVELEVERSLQADYEPDFPWEDHRGETVHPDAIKFRVFRSLCVRATVGQCMGKMIKQKKADFLEKFVEGNEPRPSFEPFVLTAGGGLCQAGRTFFSALCKHSFTHNGERSTFRKRAFGRLSIALTSYSATMNRHTASGVFA